MLTDTSSKISEHRDPVLAKFLAYRNDLCNVTMTIEETSLLLDLLIDVIDNIPSIQGRQLNALLTVILINFESCLSELNGTSEVIKTLLNPED